MDQYISIDIHIPKLLEWLISRRHCQHEWQKEVVKIRSKINAAIQDMPENEIIANILSGSHINYFNSLKIVTVLKETEADSKNIFGMYSSKRMKDWNEIVSLYQKNNVYLAEAADILINIVKYEVPSLKRQVSKQQQLHTEFGKKETDASKSKTTAQHELTNFLKELGIQTKGSGYRSELLNIAGALTASHEKIAQQTKSLGPAIHHYKSFAEYTQPNNDIEMGLIIHIAEKGNTTTYEWLHGEKPTKIVLPTPATEETSFEDTEDTIDWGYSDETDIQIEVVDSGEMHNENEITVEEPKVDPNEKLAEGSNALSVLDNALTRTNFTNQLLELKAFLKGRLLEADVENSLDSIAESPANVSEMAKSVENVLKLLTNPTIQHHYNIIHSSRYLDGILKKIQQKEDAIERATAVIAMSKERATEAAKEAVNTTKKIKVVVTKSRELQEEIAKDISQRYNGRQVNLMGGATV